MIINFFMVVVIFSRHLELEPFDVHGFSNKKGILLLDK